jgi:hypothetical protein
LLEVSVREWWLSFWNCACTLLPPLFFIPKVLSLPLAFAAHVKRGGEGGGEYYVGARVRGGVRGMAAVSVFVRGQ